MNVAQTVLYKLIKVEKKSCGVDAANNNFK